MSLKEVCNSDQLSSGAKAGSEASVHAMQSLFEEHSKAGWGLMLGDADNAFNRINRPAMLWNVRVFWSRCSIFLFNTYRGYALLIIKTSDALILSKEGITQGDLLGMKAYEIGPLEFFFYRLTSSVLKDQSQGIIFNTKNVFA